MTTIGVVSPGAMGAALGRVWVEGGHRVVATTAGRSARTHQLAHGLELLEDLAAVVQSSDLVVSVVPPEHAVSTAEAIAAAAGTSRPLVADLNAIAPVTVQRIAEALGRLELVDGSISGPPPTPGSTTVYLSGPRAWEIAVLTAPGVDLQVVGPELGTASAVKMCTASFYKGSHALLLQALRTAQHHGVVDIVLRDWDEQPAQLATRLALSASKSDRFAGEMREIALAQGEAGAVPELFQAMALVYEAVHRSDLGSLSPEQARDLSDLDEVLSRLVARRGP